MDELTINKTLHNKLVSSACVKSVINIKSYAEMFSEHVIANLYRKKKIFKQRFYANFTTYSGKMCVGLHYIMQIVCVFLVYSYNVYICLSRVVHLLKYILIIKRISRCFALYINYRG